MIHAKFKYPGYAPSDAFRLADEPTVEHMIKTSGRIWSNCAKFDSLSPSEIEKLEVVSIHAHNDESLPAIFKTLRGGTLKTIEVHVSQLELALPFIENMRSVRTLELRGEGRASIEKFQLPQINRIMSIESKLKIDPTCIPNVNHLHIRESSKGAIRRLLECLPPLESLLLCPYSPDQTANLNCSRLKFLRVVNGRSDDLSPISQFTGLTDLDVVNLGSLTSIAPLVKLRNLTDLKIGYCSRIKDIELLVSLNRLQRLMIYGCKFELEKLRTSLEGKLIEMQV